MKEDSRTILRFAVLGLVIGVVFCVFDKADFFSNSWVGALTFWVSIVICPAFFVQVMIVAGGELPLSNPTLWWFVIGLVNCLYYALIGLVYVDMRKPHRSSAEI